VLALHGALLLALWNHRISAEPVESFIMVSSLIEQPRTAPPKPMLPESPKPPQKADPPPAPRQIVAETPVVQPDDVAAPPTPPPEPAIQSPPQPVQLASELYVNCPTRSAPDYPPISRRMNEHGRVVLRVELDEDGHVAEAAIKESSGYPRLDAAALQTVSTWRCNPLVRDGAPVRAVAIQPFNFILEGG